MKKLQAGYLILEILIAIVLISAALISVSSMISSLQVRTAKSDWETEGALILQEGMEATHRALLSNWGGYADGEYYPYLDGTYPNQKWALDIDDGNAPLLEAKFRRVIELERICRHKDHGEILDCTDSDSKVDTQFSHLIKGKVFIVEKGEEREILESELLMLNQQSVITN